MQWLTDDEIRNTYACSDLSGLAPANHKALPSEACMGLVILAKMSYLNMSC